MEWQVERNPSADAEYEWILIPPEELDESEKGDISLQVPFATKAQASFFAHLLNHGCDLEAEVQSISIENSALERERDALQRDLRALTKTLDALLRRMEEK